MANQLEILGKDDEFQEAEKEANSQKKEEAELIEEEKGPDYDDDYEEKELKKQEEKEAVPEVKQVPLPELISERRARQKAQEDLQSERGRIELLEERLGKINEKLNPPPSIEEDPFQALASGQESLSQDVKNIRDELEKGQQRTQQTDIRNQVTNLEQQFKVEHPDYDQAAAHLTKVKLAEYEMAGLTDPLEQQQRLQSDLASLIQTSMAGGKNPAQSVYDIAKQAGYQQSQPRNGGEEPNTPKRSLKEIAQEAEQKSLSSVGGGAPKDGIDLETLAEMSEQEFNDALDSLEKESGQHPDKVWKHLHQ